MQYGFSLDVKEQIRQSINIVDLVGEYVQLTPKGRMYVGLCPWHDDSKPSLQVDPERQTFRCWVCADGGDIFSFMMKMENVSFPEALQMLAERAGIEVPKQSAPRNSFRTNAGFSTAKGPKSSDSSGIGDGVGEEVDYSSFAGKKPLYETAAWAEGQYHEYFRSLPETHPAKKYLNERGISSENVDKFRIGFAPAEDWKWLQNRARQDRGRIRNLTTTGYLGFSEERKSHYERFRGRLLFPIHDSQGRSVGIGGRVIPGVPAPNESAKYLNTPETPLFSKHRLLYGLDLARPSIYKKKRVLVMEGYTDTIIAHQFGFTEAVAVLGTALGLDHIRILNRLADTIYLILDGDAAGQKRTAQVLELFVAEKVDVRILTLPEENDPAEYLAEFGAERFENLIQTQANDALTHAFRIYTQGLDFTNIHQSEQAMEKLLELIAGGKQNSRDNDFGLLSYREEKMLQQLAFSFSISEEFLRRRLKEIRQKGRQTAMLRESRQQVRTVQKQAEDLLKPVKEPKADFEEWKKAAQAQRTAENGSVGMPRPSSGNWTSSLEGHSADGTANGLPNHFADDLPNAWTNRRSADSFTSIAGGHSAVPSAGAANGPLNEYLTNYPAGFDESEAYAYEAEDADASFFDGSFQPGDLTARHEAVSVTNQPGNFSAENLQEMGISADFPMEFLTDGETEESIDFASEPTLLTREAFEEHADEIDWQVFGQLNAWERELVEILMACPGVLKAVRARVTPERFLFVPARELFLRMCEMADEGIVPDFEQVLTSFESQAMKRWMIQMDARSIWHLERRKPEEEMMLLLDQIMVNFERFHLSSRKPQDIFVFNSANLNREQKLDLLDQLILEKQRKIGLTSSEGDLNQDSSQEY